MAFKLKSPFNITNVDANLGVGKGNVTQRETGVSGLQQGIIVPMAEGDQEFGSEPKGDQVNRLAKQADEGIPLGLNPKQEAKFKTKKYKQKKRDDARFDRQAEKAKKTYKRNQFENLDGGFKNPEESAGIKSDRAEESLERYSKFKILDSNLPFAEKQKMINDISSKSKFSSNKEEESPNQMLDMEKPNRAGGPIKMLKSMEDNTPAKYKSVRKAGRENLMSSLAKKGQPYE
ncbi:MAG: hypothetical protein GY810_18600 [Aureispira sp.]|nr:hypothetical protein [Aureispira sp.]